MAAANSEAKAGEARVVSIESPYFSKDEAEMHRNVCYAIAAVHHASAEHGEACYASHLLLTQEVGGGKHGYVPDDLGGASPLSGITRDGAIAQTMAIRKRCDAVVCYVDFGVSSGMQAAVDFAEAHGIPVERRTLPAKYMAAVTPPAPRSRARGGGYGRVTASFSDDDYPTASDADV